MLASDWLVSRKKVPQKWAEALRSVRAAITSALALLPVTPELEALTKDGGVCVFECLCVFVCVCLMRLGVVAEVTYLKARAILGIVRANAERNGTAGTLTAPPHSLSLVVLIEYLCVS